MDLEDMLGGGDLRSIGESNKVADQISTQDEFDSLFKFLHDKERLTVMRAADAVEKITLKHPEYLARHKDAVVNFCLSETNIEFKWHLALLMPRLPLAADEQHVVFGILKNWALNPKESKIVRANALQSLHELSTQNDMLKIDFSATAAAVAEENIPSLNARIRKLKP
jgi:hypothetical protein